MPMLVYSAQSCPQCGASTTEEVGEKCWMAHDALSELECPGTNAATLQSGLLLFPTKESLAAMDLWLDRQREVKA